MNEDNTIDFTNCNEINDLILVDDIKELDVTIDKKHVPSRELNSLENWNEMDESERDEKGR